MRIVNHLRQHGARLRQFPQVSQGHGQIAGHLAPQIHIRRARNRFERFL